MLDAAPFGLEWQPSSQGHVFNALKVSLPRLEIPQRSVYRLAMETYEATRGDQVDCLADTEQFNLLSEDTCAALRQVALDVKRVPQAYVVGTEAVLHPGEEGICPVQWSHKVPAHDFACVPAECCPDALQVYDGVCSGGCQDSVVCVANRGVVDIVLSPGQVVARVGEPSSVAPSRELLSVISGARVEAWQRTC